MAPQKQSRFVKFIEFVLIASTVWFVLFWALYGFLTLALRYGVIQKEPYATVCEFAATTTLSLFVLVGTAYLVRK